VPNNIPKTIKDYIDKSDAALDKELRKAIGAAEDRLSKQIDTAVRKLTKYVDKQDKYILEQLDTKAIKPIVELRGELRELTRRVDTLPIPQILTGASMGQKNPIARLPGARVAVVCVAAFSGEAHGCSHGW
jgi:hypothetical protein